MDGFAKIAQEVHENAVAHGWWETPRDVHEIAALIHAEWSEALEEYRAGRPDVWHKCAFNGGMCEHQDVHHNNGGCESCTAEMRKPEGIAVEMIDGCLRILDYLGAIGYRFTAEELQNAKGRMEAQYGLMNVPFVVSTLHMYTSIARTNAAYWLDAMGLAFAFVGARGLDPSALLYEKHEYNKGRPYKHGGKVC